jgi:hypothetical protein
MVGNQKAKSIGISARIGKEKPMASTFQSKVNRARPKMTRIVFSLAVLVPFTVFGVRLDAQEVSNKPVGIVVSISPHPGQSLAGPVILKTLNSEHRLGEGEFVSENDEIIVPNRDASVVISQSRGSLIICDPKNPTDTCKARVYSTGSYLSPVGKFYDAIVRITSRVGSYASSATLSTRSYDQPEAPEMELGGNRIQKIAVGERQLWLSWSGGLPPFRVSLTSSRGPIALGTSDLPEITLGPVRIARGTINLSIEDNRGRKFTAKLTASEDLPVAPNYSASAPTSELARYLAAAWLSQQDNGVYRLEAAQRLSTLARTLPVAASLRRGLLVAEPRS